MEPASSEEQLPQLSSNAEKTGAAERSALYGSADFRRSIIDNAIFTERARALLLDRWACTRKDHFVCFTSPSGHFCLSDADITEWAHELAAHNVTITEPPPSLLPRSLPARQSSSSSIARPASSIAFSTSTASLASGLSYEGTCFDGVGSLAGSGVKGIGNIIIRAFARGDAVYRDGRTRAKLAFAAHIEKRAGRMSFHRAAFRLAAPGRHVNSLMNDIWDYRGNIDYVSLLYVGMAMHFNQVRMSLYTRLKWLRIVQTSREGYYDTLGLPDADGELFYEEHEPEGDAAPSANYRVKKICALHEGRSVHHSSLAAQLSKRLLSSPSFEIFNCRIPQWLNILHLTMRCGPMQTAPRETLGKTLHKLLSLHRCDAKMVLDACPTSSRSLWGEICNDLRQWLRHHKNVDGWTAHIIFPQVAVHEIMMMAPDLHNARRRALREVNIILPLIKAVPDDVWADVAGDWYTRSVLPDIKRVADPAAYCKRLALRLVQEL